MTAASSTALRLAINAAAATAADPVAVFAVLGVHWLFFGALWGAVAWALGQALVSRPAPSLFEAAALALSHPNGLRRLLAGTATVGGLYLLGGSLIAGALLARLQARDGRSLRAGLRHLGRLLLLRLIVLGMATLLFLGGAVSLPWVFDRSLGLADERWQALVLIGSAAPLLLAALVCALLLHYGQPLLVRGASLRAVLGRTLTLIHGRPLGAAGLYLGGWLLWAAPTAINLGGMLPGPLAVLLRVIVHVWSYAAALQVTRDWATPR